MPTVHPGVQHAGGAAARTEAGERVGGGEQGCCVQCAASAAAACGAACVCLGLETCAGVGVAPELIGAARRQP